MFLPCYVAEILVSWFYYASCCDLCVWIISFVSVFKELVNVLLQIFIGGISKDISAEMVTWSWVVDFLLLILPSYLSSINLVTKGSTLPFQLMEIVSAFGPLKAYHFEINMDLNESCAFLEVRALMFFFIIIIYVSNKFFAKRLIKCRLSGWAHYSCVN